MVDPFGHASTQASLFAQMGFDGLFFARIDYQDYANRIDNKGLEFVWRGSRSSEEQTQIFTGVLHSE